ncbi:MAG: winged helix-turn-helix transcriptional regulator [Actinomycetota bacterium]|nr:helix-turn-helix transcriptional regulator [Actinomycetota bacterium]
MNPRKSSSPSTVAAAGTSPLAEALARVGDRWTLLLVDALLEGPRRFNDLEVAVAGIAPNILSQRLKQLERDGIIVARPYSRRPVRLSYELSAAGRELAGAMRLLAQWGARGTPPDVPLNRHPACGSAMEVRWYCPTCARTVDENEMSELRFI